MLTNKPVIYADVFLNVLDEVERFFGSSICCIEDIVAIVNDTEQHDDWSKDAIEVFDSVKNYAESEQLDGDVIFFS